MVQHMQGARPTAMIERVRVWGLHGALNFNIPIQDNKIVLVGVNGLGKTTIVSMLYFFLTKQWQRLSSFSFKSIEVTIDGQALLLEQTDLLSNQKMRSWFMHAASTGDAELLLQRLRKVTLSDDGGVDIRHFQKLIRELENMRESSAPVSSSRLRFLLQRQAWFRSGFRLSKRVLEVSEAIEAAGVRVLYMPTYRRIEQDLESIFPGMSEDMREQVQSRIHLTAENDKSFVELVEFGMGDVEKSLKRVTEDIRNTSRIEFSNLAGSYLRDVIRGEARAWDRTRILQVSEQQALAILSRVDENTLLPDDRTKIVDALGRARAGEELSDDDQLLTHFFWKLTVIFDNQKELESPLRSFMASCNKYLTGKSFVLDEAQLAVSCVTDPGDRIELKHLSSGEKQVVSLFSQLLLEPGSAWYVVIDEPELSLSVAWQKELLPDLIATGRCHFVAAVTHSPFIFDNNMRRYAADLSELMEDNNEFG